MTTPWTSETSWTVSRGSLDSVVTFESFDFPIDSESTSRKPPLLLLPPSSSDFEPCEIKLNFTQKHEIRQVYVRSTARIYEIYYATSLQNDNEYLCTVRCSTACVDDNTFPVKEAISVNSEGLNDKSPKANEDEWVEVKLPVDQTLNCSRNYQDLYEATAEINDSEACMSLTIRLLSLQTKGCIYIDEIYVFADPSDSDDQTETSANSSLMTMLVPTLLGLTKSRNVQLDDQNSSRKLIKTESEPTTSTDDVIPFHPQDETCQKLTEVKNSTPDKDKVCDRETGNERVEILLEQLVTRVSRIEDMCMRFEEKMLKPLNNIEARLQRVEQQVDLLARCPVSPLFSRLEPDPVPSDHGNDSQLPKIETSMSGTHEPLEDTDEEFSSCEVDESSNQLPELEKTMYGTHEPPEDTVEEFSCCEVDESSKEEKPKKRVSIDDALAAALSGFSSFTKQIDDESHEEECLKHNHDSIEEESLVSCKSLNETAPDVERDEATTSSDDDDEEEEAVGPTASPSSPQETADDPQEPKILICDILKHYSDQLPDACDSKVDFESPILEVKFASSENGNLKSSLEALLTGSDDAASPDANEDEEQIEATNKFLVDLDDNDIGKEVQQDCLQTSFASLI